MPADLTSPQAFETLVREHQAMVFRTLARMTAPGPHVEDLAQEVFLRLYRALPHFRGDSTLTTYLYRIVVNVAQDEWKRRRREREFAASPHPAFDEDESSEWLENLPGDAVHGHARTPEQLLSDAELQSAVDAALLALPEAERAVLVLYHQEDCSYDAISAALEMPINTVRTHLHRGRKRMSQLISARLAPPAGETSPRYSSYMEVR
ncbi:MAG TPA: sigma-70 family RNA polymerase sigma factor [Candidatus Aquilonibacter sp.]|nr:sigma-70 family RNA polymerase sigma factor [Candidatus Aquilonibacter sp.]